jgi:glycine dehydrogenase subunit 1
MDFISNQSPQINQMLAAIGIHQIEDLFQDIPPHLRLPKPVINDGLSESEGMRLMEEIASRNTFPSFDNYLGAGAYQHHVPALVGAICGKSEFLTSYTPYQAEASQGMLQIIFEFQSALCALTGMDVSNASVYDGASACAEAVLMALRIQNPKGAILVAGNLNPHYRAVVDQYAAGRLGQSIETISLLEDGCFDFDDLNRKINGYTAAVLIQYPNFFGTIEDVRRVSAIAREHGALTILCANPLVYGLFASAGELGADIAVGDCQPLGLPLHFGGPYAGYMCCRQEYVRQMPGRIVGETVDSKGQRGFVLTLQTREQHIRREKATSNICTNQALAALASLVGLLWYSKDGLRELALTNYQRASYLRDRLSRVKGVVLIGPPTLFNEFVVKFDRPLKEVVYRFRSSGIEPGLELGRYFAAFKQCLLVAVTESKSREQLDRYVEVVEQICMEG